MVSGPALADCPTLCVQLASVSQLITELLMKLLLTLALIWVQSWLWDGAIWSSHTRLRAFKVHGSRRTPGQTHLTEFWIFLDQLGRLQLMANWQKKVLSVSHLELEMSWPLTTASIYRILHGKPKEVGHTIDIYPALNSTWIFILQCDHSATKVQPSKLRYIDSFLKMSGIFKYPKKKILIYLNLQLIKECLEF